MNESADAPCQCHSPGGVTRVDRLLPAVLDGTVDPGEVFDRTLSLEETPQGYHEMDERTALKVLVTP